MLRFLKLCCIMASVISLGFQHENQIHNQVKLLSDRSDSFCFSVPQSCLTLCDPMDCSTPVFPDLHHLQRLLKLMSIESLSPSNHLAVIPFSSSLQSFPASWSFLMSWLFASGGQSIGASASASVF